MQYTYGAVGNVLENDRVLGGVPIHTTHTYNAANQLTTGLSSSDPVTWHYTYDDNGSLREITPSGLLPGFGARRYTYNTAGFLLKVETHDGTGYQVRAEMGYDGLGQRLNQTVWDGSQSMTTHYVFDPLAGARPLSASAGGQDPRYLYGLVPLGEQSAGWSYYLTDGLRSSLSKER